VGSVDGEAEGEGTYAVGGPAVIAAIIATVVAKVLLSLVEGVEDSWCHCLRVCRNSEELRRRVGLKRSSEGSSVVYDGKDEGFEVVRGFRLVVSSGGTQCRCDRKEELLGVGDDEEVGEEMRGMRRRGRRSRDARHPGRSRQPFDATHASPQSKGRLDLKPAS